MNSHAIIQIVIFTILAIILFVLIQPGNLFTIPGNTQWISYRVSETNKTAVLVHTAIYAIVMGCSIILYVNIFSNLIYPLLPNP
jgi:hypothetical protein